MCESTGFTGVRAFLEVGIYFQFQGTFIWESDLACMINDFTL